jgi:hypothetical protein
MVVATICILNRMKYGLGHDPLQKNQPFHTLHFNSKNTKAEFGYKQWSLYLTAFQQITLAMGKAIQTSTSPACASSHLLHATESFIPLFERVHSLAQRFGLEQCLRLVTLMR